MKDKEIVREYEWATALGEVMDEGYELYDDKVIEELMKSDFGKDVKILEWKFIEADNPSREHGVAYFRVKLKARKSILRKLENDGLIMRVG